MKYLIRHGNIAAIQFVTTPDGRVMDAIYLAENKVDLSIRGCVVDFAALPLAVRAAINKQFGQVFSLPLERREAWVKAQVPFEVEI